MNDVATALGIFGAGFVVGAFAALLLMGLAQSARRGDDQTEADLRELLRGRDYNEHREGADDDRGNH